MYDLEKWAWHSAATTMEKFISVPMRYVDAFRQRRYGIPRLRRGGPYRRCADDRLYDYVKRHDVDFFVEYDVALDLLMTDDGTCRGNWRELATGQFGVFLTHQVILATGGYGQVYASATSSSTCTGDGNAMVLRAGLPLADMEFVQFHPTGLYGTGILISGRRAAKAAFF
ncbi:MAG: FAD-binding protein [Rickettsiales bacterium]